jgi:hypothetical protein
MYPLRKDWGMPTIELTDEQASFLDALRDAIEDELVGPYGTVRRGDALQYLIDNYGEPDELLGDGSAAEVAGESEPGDEEEDAETDEDAEDAEAVDEDDDSGSESSGGPPSPGGGDAMLDEMMSLLDTHDDKWSETDSAETSYEVDLPDGGTETVTTKDDVRAILFKNYR